MGVWDLCGDCGDFGDWLDLAEKEVEKGESESGGAIGMKNMVKYKHEDNK